MTSIEIRELLNANLDRGVQVLWDDGEKEDVMVVSVDDEGFVYDLIPADPKTPYWNRFDEVTEILPQAIAYSDLQSQPESDNSS